MNASDLDLVRLERRRRYKREWARKWWAANRDFGRARQRALYAKNPDRAAAYQRAYRLRHTDYVKQRQKLYRVKHATSIRLLYSKWRKSHLAERAAYLREWNKKNRDRARTHRSKSAKKRMMLLWDSYIKTLLRKDGLRIFPRKLIELKRAQLKLKRALREQNEIKANISNDRRCA